MTLADSKLPQGKYSDRISASMWRRAVSFGLAYFLCAELSSCLTVKSSPFETFWLPAGLYVAVLLLNEYRAWPWLVLAALPANLAFDFLHGTPLAPILVFYSANTLQAVAGAWLVRCFVTERPTLATLKEFVGLMILAAGLSTALGAVIGAGTLVYFGLDKSFAQSWRSWWGSTAMAVLVLTPFILTWFTKPALERNESGRPKRIAEALILFFGLCVYVWYLLTMDTGIMSPNKSIGIPFILWAGLRFGVRGATAASLFLSISMTFFTAQYLIGLTPQQIASGAYVFVLQVVLSMTALMALIPAVIIGERNRTLAELRESEERFKNLAAAAFEGICISENGKILDVNNQFVAMFGYEKRDEILGRQIIELIAPEWRESVAERIRAGQGTIMGHQLLRKDGSIFPAEAQARMVSIGGRTLRMTALRDITERKRTETSLRQSEERFSLMFKNSPLAVALIGLASGKILDVNESFLRMAGYTREETIGHTALEMKFYPDPSQREFILNQLHQHGHLHGHEQRFREKSGRIQNHVLWFDVMTIGGEQCTLVTALDVTERKRAEAEREEAVIGEQRRRAEYTLQLIASQEAERTRIARELHDSLGQNLLHIKNRAQLEIAKTTLPDAIREELQNISNLTSQAIAEVRQISHDLHPHQLDNLGLTRALQALIDNADESSAVAIAGKFDSADDLFPREAATNIYRIVQESLNNILKHSRAKNARITLERDLHEVLLRIEDDGCGFLTGRNADAEDGKGLGLKNIAERVRTLGGKTILDSQPGQGTRIEISIPISSEQR
jgi:PAS domain S-box-containing protein